MTILPIKKVLNKESKESDIRSNELTYNISTTHNVHPHFVPTYVSQNFDRNINRHRGSLPITSHYVADRPSTSFDTGTLESTMPKRKVKKSPSRYNRKHKGKKSHVVHKALEHIQEYNSGDEYEPSFITDPDEITEIERVFEKSLKENKGWKIKKMSEDGACLFRAVADQVYGDQEMHGIVRKQCIEYMRKNADYFSHFVTENFDQYLERKARSDSHGNHLEIQALAEMYNRPMQVFEYDIEPINIFHGYGETANEPIRLSYHKNSHYNSIVNPFTFKPGVGLGLPTFVSGSVDHNFLRDGIRASETMVIEEAMLKDKLEASDWEATNQAIEEQVARESYLQWLRDNEKIALSSTSSNNKKHNGSSEQSSCFGNNCNNNLMITENKNNIGTNSNLASNLHKSLSCPCPIYPVKENAKNKKYESDGNISKIQNFNSTNKMDNNTTVYPIINHPDKEEKNVNFEQETHKMQKYIHPQNLKEPPPFSTFQINYDASISTYLTSCPKSDLTFTESSFNTPTSNDSAQKSSNRVAPIQTNKLSCSNVLLMTPSLTYTKADLMQKDEPIANISQSLLTQSNNTKESNSLSSHEINSCSGIKLAHQDECPSELMQNHLTIQDDTIKAKNYDELKTTFDPQLFGLNDWSVDEDVLRAIIASQDEYMETLKKN